MTEDDGLLHENEDKGRTNHMLLADGWKDYEVIDTSDGEKLERWGKYILVRPDPQVIWKTERTHPLWKKPNAVYHRSSKGGGEWEFISLPDLEEAEQNPFTVDEQKALWKSYESGSRDAAIPLIMIYTGMMTGEMEKLERSMIRWDENLIVGVSMKTKIRKKSPVFFPAA